MRRLFVIEFHKMLLSSSLLTTVLFRHGEAPAEIETGADLSALLITD